MSGRAEEICLALGGRRSGRGWIVRCPAHHDRSPSLAMHERGGRLLVHCWSGCSQSEVIASLRALGLWPDGRLDSRPLERKPRRYRQHEDRSRERAWKLRWAEALEDLREAWRQQQIAETLLREDPSGSDPRLTRLLQPPLDPWLRSMVAEERLNELEATWRREREGGR